MTPIEAAKAEALRYFKASLLDGSTIVYVGQSWEEKGFQLDENDNPHSDKDGNRVSLFAVEELDTGNTDHVLLCEEWGS